MVKELKITRNPLNVYMLDGIIKEFNTFSSFRFIFSLDQLDGIATAANSVEDDGVNDAAHIEPQPEPTNKITNKVPEVSQISNL